MKIKIQTCLPVMFERFEICPRTVIITTIRVTRATHPDFAVFLGGVVSWAAGAVSWQDFGANSNMAGPLFVRPSLASREYFERPFRSFIATRPFSIMQCC